VRVFEKPIAGFRVLTYHYRTSHRPNEGMEFAFHLLCEVGEPWQVAALRAQQELADEQGCAVETVELPCWPWYVDALIPNNLSGENHV
jgi:hypothetical protein